MTRLRIAHRLCGVTAAGTGLVLLRDGFTGEVTAHPLIVLIWIASSTGVAVAYRRMRITAYRNTHHQNPKETR